MTSEAQPPTVLVVEDDEPTQKLLRAILRRSGFAAEIAGDGGQAISALRERDYAAVVLDIMMPVISGHDVVEFLSRSGKAVPVVVCSAAGPKELADFDPGVVKAVVHKPFGVDQFVAAVTAAVDGADRRIE